MFYIGSSKTSLMSRRQHDQKIYTIMKIFHLDLFKLGIINVVVPDPKESEGFCLIRIRIRIRKKFGFGYGIGFRYCNKIKIIHKNHRLNTWKRTKCALCFFLGNTFFFFLQVPEYTWKQWEPLYRKLFWEFESVSVKRGLIFRSNHDFLV
jgi:hypothetical protein